MPRHSIQLARLPQISFHGEPAFGRIISRTGRLCRFGIGGCICRRLRRATADSRAGGTMRKNGDHCPVGQGPLSRHSVSSNSLSIPRPDSYRRFSLYLVLAATSCLACARTGCASEVPTTNKELRENAIQSIPFDRLTAESKSRILSVVNRPTIHRRLPSQDVECHPDVHIFLLRHPEVVVNMWQIMGATSMKLMRIGPYSFDSTDGAGTDARVELVYGTPEVHVLYGEGRYEGPLLKRATTGRCVMLLRSEYAADDTRRTRIGSSLDVFMQLDNVGAEIVAKTLQPLFGKTADHNFAETAKFVGRVSEAIESNGEGVERLASRLTNVQPEVRDQFARLAQRVHAQTAARMVRAEVDVDDGSSTNVRANAASRLGRRAVVEPLR